MTLAPYQERDRKRIATQLQKARRRVTICIAAICTESGTDSEPRIVACTDWLISGPLGSADTMLKQKALNDNWRLLTAGSPDDIRAVELLLIRAFDGLPLIDETNIVPTIQGALRARLKQKKDEFSHSLYSVDFDGLIKIGTLLPSDLYRDAVYRASQIQLEATFIIAGFDNERLPYLIQTDETGRVVIKEEPFSVIGEGAALAQASLLQREISSVNTLDETTYKVWEAKKVAERVGSVGETDSIVTMYPGGRYSILSLPGYDRLKQLYKLFGPKEITEINLDRNFFRQAGKGT